MGIMEESLVNKHCIPCKNITPPLTAERVIQLLPHVPGWRVEENHHLLKEFRFKNFNEALAFVNKAGELAEYEGHHPDIKFGWGYARMKLTTHVIGGLSENDFIMAAKIDLLLQN